MLHYIVVLNRYILKSDNKSKKVTCNLYDYDIDSAYETKEQARERILEIYKNAQKTINENQTIELDEYYNLDIDTYKDKVKVGWDWYRIILR